MRKWVFKNRGLLLLPSAIGLLILGKPNYNSILSGFILLLLGEGLRIWGVGYAGTTTRADTVKAPYLVTGGPYSYVKNPLYAGNFLIGLAFCIIACGEVVYPVKIFLFLFFLLSYLLVYGSIIPLEEGFLAEKFGKEYIKYSNWVPRLIPFEKPYPHKKGVFSWFPIRKGEIHTLIYLSLSFLYFSVRVVFFQ